MMGRGNGNFNGEVALLFCQPWLSDKCVKCFPAINPVPEGQG